jgi:hypothetical protein
MLRCCWPISFMANQCQGSNSFGEVIAEGWHEEAKSCKSAVAKKGAFGRMTLVREKLQVDEGTVDLKGPPPFIAPSISSRTMQLGLSFPNMVLGG